jgi:hypothetical protein
VIVGLKIRPPRPDGKTGGVPSPPLKRGIDGMESRLKEKNMTADQPKPKAVTTQPPLLVLEIAGLEDQTPFLIPVRIQNLSTEAVTLAVTFHWGIADWNRFRGRDCVLRVEDPGGQQLANIKAKIAWSKFSDKSSSPLSLGLLLTAPASEALKRLSGHITQPSQDIKELWKRYDHVRESPGYSHLMHRLYLAGLALLVAGVALQLTASPSSKMVGWVLWFLGSLAIAGKVMRSFRQNRAPQ